MRCLLSILQSDAASIFLGGQEFFPRLLLTALANLHDMFKHAENIYYETNMFALLKFRMNLLR